MRTMRHWIRRQLIRLADWAAPRVPESFYDRHGN